MQRWLDRLLLRIARLTLPNHSREWMAGDIEEDYRRLAETRGRIVAMRWLLAEIARNAGNAVTTLTPRLEGTLMRNIVRDARYAVRQLAASPIFAATIVLTLALGIGANTAIFSVVDALLFKPLPYPHADRLYAVTLANASPQGMQFWPYPKYAALAREDGPFEAAAAYARRDQLVAVNGLDLRVESEVVTSSYFDVFGAPAAIGRVFSADEDTTPERDAVAILGDGLWRSAFGGDRNVLGKSVTIKGRSYVVIGVMRPDFRGQTGRTQLWLPVMMADHFMYKGAATGAFSWWMRVVARLKPGVTSAAADAQMPALTARVATAAPSFLKTATRDGRELFQLVQFRDVKVDPEVSRSFVVVLAAVGFVLLIACANTANLLLGRAVTRQSEFALRRALGASPAAIVRQVLTESLLLAAVAGIAALAVAIGLLHWLTTAKPMNATGFWSQYAGTFDYFAVSLDPRVAAVNFGVALGIGVLFGIAPARAASRGALHASLKQSADSPRGFRRFNTRAALVLTEVAFSMMLLISAGLMVKSFARAASADLGVEPRGVITVSTSMEDRRSLTFFRDLLQQVRGIPGVDDAALAAELPLSGRGNSGPIAIEDTGGERKSVRANMNVVTPGFFRVTGVALRSGRLLTDDDRETAPRVAIVNRAMAQAAWPGQDPIGRRIKHDFRVAYGSADEWTTVVGVVDDVVYDTLEEPVEPMLYLPAWQPLGTPAGIAIAPARIAMRTALPVDTIVAALRERLRAAGAPLALFDVATMSERAARMTSRYRYSSAMMGALAALALVLSAIGVYGVMAYSVAMRRREIGIRVALGARPRDVLRVVLGSGVKLAAAGVLLGLAGAFAGSRVLGRMLYGVTAHDPWTFAAIAVLMIVVVLAACYVPARRAMRVDPVVALRA